MLRIEAVDDLEHGPVREAHARSDSDSLQRAPTDRTNKLGSTGLTEKIEHPDAMAGCSSCPER